jgi:hypothetical protein
MILTRGSCGVVLELSGMAIQDVPFSAPKHNKTFEPGFDLRSRRWLTAAKCGEKNWNPLIL